MKLYNSATKQKEELKPLKEGEIGVYSCGPTVYWNQHIGHMYAYVQWDTMVRFLRYQGFNVKWVMNITDVGHLTSDEDTGEDKMEKGAKREGLSVWDIAEKYIEQFRESLDLLNVTSPDVLSRATNHIEVQIALNKKIEANGFSYKTKRGLIFDTSKFADYSKFAGLKLEKQTKRDGFEDDPEKKLPWDFFLWVNDSKHIMKWDSPWGEGYPGWHIECTAMSTKYLGNKFDIHTGGIDHIPVHHTNEIAQGYGAFGETTANFWLHNGMLTAKSGEKMSKSSGNFVTAQELVQKGYNPIALRYLILTSHYRKGLSFSFEALDAANTAYAKLVELTRAWRTGGRNSLSDEKMEKIDKFRQEFVEKISDDLNFPEALAVLWKAAKSNIPNTDKLDLILEFDQVLGLGLNKRSFKEKIPDNVLKLAKRREELRGENKFKESDKLREEMQKLGYIIEDGKGGAIVKKIKT